MWGKLNLNHQRVTMFNSTAMYYVPPTKDKYPEWVNVTSNGTDWVYLSNGRLMNIKTLATNNGGQCYHNESDFIDNSDSEATPM